LPEHQAVTCAFKQASATGFNVGEGVVAINFRLSYPKEVEVWAVEDIYGLRHETFVETTKRFF
jgi:hypothetical protein